jgi:hypothetical protein
MLDLRAARITYNLTVIADIDADTESWGTCFTYRLVKDKKEHIFLITAKHLVENIDPASSKFFISTQSGNHRLEVINLLCCDDDIDVAAIEIVDNDKLELNVLGNNVAFNEGRIDIGQDVFFLGFPLQDRVKSSLGEIFKQPVPLVKKGIFSSGIYSDNTPDKISGFYLDGHNNPGFSGGPVVFNDRSVADNKKRFFMMLMGTLE